MTDFGSCVECDQPAVVKVNDRPFCIDHYNGAMVTIGQMLSQMTGEALNHMVSR